MRNLWLFVLPWCVFLSHPTNLFGAFTNVIDLSPGADLPTILSNVPNDSVIRIAAGVYPVVPSKVLSNGVGGINIFSKSNIVVEGVPGETVIDGRSALGEILFVTNCSHLTLRGVTVLGLVVTNHTLVSGIGHVWSSLSVYGVDNFLVENCRFIDGHDHGIHDVGAQPNWNLISTNNIVIRSNYFDNFGSARTNEAVFIDGTAVVPTGWLVENNEFVNCLRCVEPFSESDEVPNVFFNCIIRSNRMINTLDAAILTAGSTNAHNVLIEGNYIYNEPGYTRRGTNTAGEVAVFLNGGQGHIIRRNQIINPSYIGVLIGGDRTMKDVVIEDNLISGANSEIQGFGIHTYSSAGPELLNFQIRNNHISTARNYAMQLYSLKDGVVEGNRIVDPAVLYGPAIKLAVFGSSFNTNVLIARNEIVDSTGVMSSGVEVSQGNKSIRVIDNCVSGGWVGPIVNDAGGETVFASRGSNCNADLVPLFINEWKVEDRGAEDDSDDGEGEWWFELYNAANYSVDLGGYFLTDDLGEKLKCAVPDNQKYVISPGGFLVFSAEGLSDDGSGDEESDPDLRLHPSGGTIGLFTANGVKIDAVTFVAQSNKLVEARIPDGAQKRWSFAVPTPGMSNVSSLAPRNVQVEFEQGVATLSFDAVPGFTYKVEYKDRLGDRDWQPIAPGQEAGSENVRLVDEASTNLERYYRVVGLAY